MRDWRRTCYPGLLVANCPVHGAQIWVELGRLATPNCIIWNHADTSPFASKILAIWCAFEPRTAKVTQHRNLVKNKFTFLLKSQLVIRVTQFCDVAFWAFEGWVNLFFLVCFFFLCAWLESLIFNFGLSFLMSFCMSGVSYRRVFLQKRRTASEPAQFQSVFEASLNLLIQWLTECSDLCMFSFLQLVKQ